MHQKHPSWLLFTWRGNIHSAGSFRRRKQFRNVPTVCTSLLPAHIMSGQIKDFYLFWWEPESETFASVPDSHPVCWFFSPFLSQCKCQTVIFWVMGRSAAPPKPPPLWHERLCWWESWLRNFGSSIQQAEKRNLFFKLLLVQLVWLMWQLETKFPPSQICHSTIMWPWRQYGSGATPPSNIFLHVFQTLGEILSWAPSQKAFYSVCRQAGGEAAAWMMADILLDVGELSKGHRGSVKEMNFASAH